LQSLFSWLRRWIGPYLHRVILLGVSRLTYACDTPCCRRLGRTRAGSDICRRCSDFRWTRLRSRCPGHTAVLLPASGVNRRWIRTGEYIRSGTRMRRCCRRCTEPRRCSRRALRMRRQCSSVDKWRYRRSECIPRCTGIGRLRSGCSRRRHCSHCPVHMSCHQSDVVSKRNCQKSDRSRSCRSIHRLCSCCSLWLSSSHGRPHTCPVACVSCSDCRR